MIGQRIQFIRKYHGETQQTLADRLHMSVHTIRYWEQGKGSITVENVIAICKYYHVSADYLLGLIDEEPNLKKQQHDALTQENKDFLRRLEVFLLHDQKANTKKSTR